jgi:hypothetical protein
MTHHNFNQSLTAFLKRKPFRAFLVHFTDGENVVVEHPEAVRYQGKGTAVYFGKQGEIVLFDHDGVSRFAAASKAAAK